jgi:hypothetical protein
LGSQVVVGIGGRFEESNVHILTKVLMVFAAVLAIFLSALTIAYSANTDKIVSDYAQESARRAAAEASASVQVAQAGEEQVRLNAQLDAANRDNQQIKVRADDLERENAELRDARARAEAAVDALKGEQRVLAETANTQAKLLENYRSEVSKLLTAELAFRKRELELDERIGELESQREVLQANVRALQEQLTETRVTQGPGGSSPAMAVGGLGRPAADTSFVSSGPLVRTKVTRVTTDTATGSPLAQIGVGSAGGFRTNQKLFVVRNGNFVANVVLVQTDLQWSIGRIDSLGQPADVREGDEVWSRLNN